MAKADRGHADKFKEIDGELNKICPTCESRNRDPWHPLTGAYYGVRKHASTGFQSRCKKCFYEDRKVKRSTQSVSQLEKPLKKTCKNCPKCKQWKPHAEFYKNKNKADDLSSECKECNKKAVAANTKKKRQAKILELSKQSPKTTKFCPDCGEERPFSEFGKRSDRKDGFKPYCKKHTNERQKQYYHENPEFADKNRAASRKWAKDNPEKHNAKTKRWYHENEDNIAKRNKISLEWHSQNKERVRTRQRVYEKERYNSDPNYKLRKLLRSRIYNIFRSAARTGDKAGSHVKDLGCSIEELISYIEAKFAPGMSWDNHGTVWELDHIEPLASFDLTDRDQFLEACCYTNLQPLTIEEHLEKTSKEVGR